VKLRVDHGFALFLFAPDSPDSSLFCPAENLTAIQGLKPLDPVPVTPELKAWPPGS